MCGAANLIHHRKHDMSLGHSSSSGTGKFECLVFQHLWQRRVGVETFGPRVSQPTVKSGAFGALSLGSLEVLGSGF